MNNKLTKQYFKEGLGWKERIATYFLRAGIFRNIQRLQPQVLTVLNYHRVSDPSTDSSKSFKPNISSLPNQFKDQMKMVTNWFNVISVSELNQFVINDRSLPPHAAIITFDDGYLDNYINAYPILESYQTQAVIFLSTDYIDNRKPFFWDFVSFCFYSTHQRDFNLPGIGKYSWRSNRQLDGVINSCVEEIKKKPETKKGEYLNKLQEYLGVKIPDDAFCNRLMNWDQVRELKSKGIEFGAHTMTHPILSRVSLQQAKSEIMGSKSRIEDEIGEEIVSFAYPNGKNGDYNEAIKALVAQSGFQIAFSLINGQCSYRFVKKDPFDIKRIFISTRDTIPRFAAKLSGFSRFIDT